jgi:hypothetical protein
MIHLPYAYFFAQTDTYTHKLYQFGHQFVYANLTDINIILGVSSLCFN